MLGLGSLNVKEIWGEGGTPLYLSKGYAKGAHLDGT